MLGDYPISVWLMFFYVYCVFGWCFETTYVSVFCEHRFVNRGFLFGPWLPLYGSGALVILVSTLPVRDNVWLTALVGMAAATLLEYVTGVAMEALFKVRYWDYSKHRFNFQGHICLQSSLAWGALSALLVKVVHRPVEDMVLLIDPHARQLIVLGASVLFTADATRSTITAIDLRRLLIWLDGAREDMKKLQARAEAVEAQLMEDYHLRRDQLAEGLKTRRDELSGGLRQRGEQLADGVKARGEQVSESYRLGLERLQDELDSLRE
ncbi:MAG: hypothetical protein IJ048_05810, partial [Clostridia bacterium]|nr:hypothetical protein [Clostridia bacterium]